MFYWILPKIYNTGSVNTITPLKFESILNIPCIPDGAHGVCSYHHLTGFNHKGPSITSIKFEDIPDHPDNLDVDMSIYYQQYNDFYLKFSKIYKT